MTRISIVVFRIRSPSQLPQLQPQFQLFVSSYRHLLFHCICLVTNAFPIIWGVFWFSCRPSVVTTQGQLLPLFVFQLINLLNKLSVLAILATQISDPYNLFISNTLGWQLAYCNPEAGGKTSNWKHIWGMLHPRQRNVWKSLQLFTAEDQWWAVFRCVQRTDIGQDRGIPL